MRRILSNLRHISFAGLSLGLPTLCWAMGCQNSIVEASLDSFARAFEQRQEHGPLGSPLDLKGTHSRAFFEQFALGIAHLLENMSISNFEISSDGLSFVAYDARGNSWMGPLFEDPKRESNNEIPMAMLQRPLGRASHPAIQRAGNLYRSFYILSDSDPTLISGTYAPTTRINAADGKPLSGLEQKRAVVVTTHATILDNARGIALGIDTLNPSQLAIYQLDPMRSNGFSSQSTGISIDGIIPFRPQNIYYDPTTQALLIKRSNDPDRKFVLYHPALSWGALELDIYPSNKNFALFPQKRQIIYQNTEGDFVLSDIKNSIDHSVLVNFTTQHIMGDIVGLQALEENSTVTFLREDGTLQSWNTQEGKWTYLREAQKKSKFVSLAPNAKMAIEVSARSISLSNINHQNDILWTSEVSDISAAYFSPDSQIILCKTTDGEGILLDTTTGLAVLSVGKDVASLIQNMWKKNNVSVDLDH